METSTPSGTRDVDVKGLGRTVKVRLITDMQFLLLSRDADKIRQDGISNSDRLRIAGRMMDVMESMVVTQEDRDYLMDLTVRGELHVQDMMDFLTAFRDEEAAEKPKVRRGRPPGRRTTQ